MAKRKTKASSPKNKNRRKKETRQETPANDPMSQCVTLCQEQRWREALLLCRRVAEQTKEDKDGVQSALSGAETKIEYSLRRQMAAALIQSAKEILAKEYLLDVGE